MSKKVINQFFFFRECPLKEQDKAETYDPDYANINGIRLARKNEEIAFCKNFTNDEARRLFDEVNGKRLPTKYEWEQMLDAGYTWDDDRKGIWVGKRHAERRETKLSTFLPAAGYRYYSTSALKYAGTYGYYWSSTVNSTYSYNLHFNSSSVTTDNYNSNAYGFSIRCVAE